MSQDRSSVEAVVKHYFDALYEGDADKMGAIFHPSADLRWLEKGELQVLTVPDWLGVSQARLGQGRRQAARGFHRHHRPLRRLHRLHQGALPAAAALFHRLSGGDEAEGRLADRLEILPLRSARLITPARPRASRPASPSATAEITADHPRHDRRVQQPFRRRLEIGDLQEGDREPGVMPRGQVQLADVPVDELHLRRARTLDLRMPQIVADRDIPGHVDRRLRR